MANRTCLKPECDKPLRARGLCVTHYNQAHQPGAHPSYTTTCECCCETYATKRSGGRFCSLLCRDIWRNGGRPTLSELPPSHPVTRLTQGLPAVPPATPPRLRIAAWQMECGWCGTEFVTRKQAQRVCSRRCAVRARRARRRGLELGWSSHYTWAEVMRLFLALGKACAYCSEVIDGQPDPDHVVPLSRGGSNSITNILPCCSPCNSDKRDLLLSEWNADRERRHLPPRTVEDPRWIHLTSTSARLVETDVAQCG